MNLSNKHILFYFIISLIFYISACHPIICKWDLGYKQLTDLPNKDSLIGNYYLTKESRDFIEEEGYFENCELRIYENGEYEILNAPNLIIEYYKTEKRRIFNKKGKWFATCIDSECMFELEGIAVIPIARKKERPISFLITISDGDDCLGIIFEREK